MWARNSSSGGGALEDREPADVHVRVRLLLGEEARVDRRQAVEVQLGGHRPIVSGHDPAYRPTVLITGCSSGSATTAERLAARAGPCTRPRARPETLADLEARGCRTLALDVTDEASMHGGGRSAIEGEHGSIGALVNNAGYSQSGAVETVPMEKVRAQFETNVFGLMRLCQLVLPGMRRARRAASSTCPRWAAGLVFPGGGFYHATKYAVEALSDALRFEVKGFGIDVILVEPGLIRTAFGDRRRRRRRSRRGRGRLRAVQRPRRRCRPGIYESGGPIARLGGPPEAVAKVIDKALAAKRPRARYTVTPSAKVLIANRAVLPDRAWDALMRQQFPSPGRMNDVERLAERAQREGRLGIDTEFMPEGRYRPLLCLVQICVGGEIVVLDPLEGFDPRRWRPCSPTPRSRSCSTPGARTWRSCAASGAPTSPACSTQVAAGFAGFAAQAGYTGLLHDVLRIRVAKTASFTRWDARPLTAEQSPTRARTSSTCCRWPTRSRSGCARPGGSSGRARSAARSPRRPTSATPRRCGGGCRAPAGWTRASARWQELAAWRERTAMREDRPVGSIVRDPTLVELAKRQPAGRRELGQIRGHPRHRAPPQRRPARRARARPQRAADPARGVRAAADGVRGRTSDGARGVAGARPRAGGRAGLRADRRARRPDADRRLDAARGPGTRRAHAQGLAPRAGGGPSCSSCCAGAGD